MKICDKTTDQKNSEENAHLGQNEDGVAARSTLATKSMRLAELLRRPGAYDQIDSAWRLAMWLMLTEKGVVVCGYDEIAERLGDVSRHTVRKWADALEAKGVLERQSKGKVVELRLKGDYLEVAAAPDAIRNEGPAVRQASPAVLSMMKIIEGAGELGGRVAMKIEGCDFGVGK